MTDQDKLDKIQQKVNIYGSKVGIKCVEIMQEKKDGEGSGINALLDFKKREITLTNELLKKYNTSGYYINHLICHELIHIKRDDNYSEMGLLPISKWHKVIMVLTELRADMEGAGMLSPNKVEKNLDRITKHMNSDYAECKRAAYPTREERKKYIKAYIDFGLNNALREALQFYLERYELKEELFKTYLLRRVNTKQNVGWFREWYRILFFPEN